MIFRKTKVVLNFKKDKPTMYKIAQVNMPAIGYKEFVKECSLSCGVNPSQTDAVVTAVLDRLIHYMSIGHMVNLGGFGSFKPAFRSKTTRNLEDADITTVTGKIVRFFPGKDFREMLRNINIKSAAEALSVEE